MTLQDILRRELSPLRLATFAVVALLLALAGGIWAGDPFLMLAWAWPLGNSWAVVVAVAPLPAGPAPRLARLAAATAFPLLLMLLGSAAWMLGGRSVVVLGVTAVWACAIPLALAAWRHWRDNTVPARLIASAALVALVVVHGAAFFMAGNHRTVDFFGVQHPVILPLLLIGVILAFSALVAPPFWRRWPDMPAFTPAMLGGCWLLAVGFEGLIAAWLVVLVLAMLTPLFARAPRRSRLSLLPASPVGVAGLLMLAAALAALGGAGAGLESAGRIGHYRLPETWLLVMVVTLYAVRDLVIWRLLRDIANRLYWRSENPSSASSGERVLPLFWLAWVVSIHVAGALVAELAPGWIDLALAFTLPWTILLDRAADPTSLSAGRWLISATVGASIAGAAALYASRSASARAART